MGNKFKRGEMNASQNGQAMLEYVLLTFLVVVASFAVYVRGRWFSAVQQFLHEALTVITLPIP
ncbi:MAG: hypothetical protein EOL87_17525 [Spartobacteria bacterium]|nr:hypothetical protein [Spartobacteria bacterium]